MQRKVYFYSSLDHVTALREWLDTKTFSYSQSTTSEGSANEFVAVMNEADFRPLANEILNGLLPYQITDTRRTEIVTTTEASGVQYVTDFDIDSNQEVVVGSFISTNGITPPSGYSADIDTIDQSLTVSDFDSSRSNLSSDQLSTCDAFNINGRSLRFDMSLNAGSGSGTPSIVASFYADSAKTILLASVDWDVSDQSVYCVFGLAGVYLSGSGATLLSQDQDAIRTFFSSPQHITVNISFSGSRYLSINSTVIKTGISLHTGDVGDVATDRVKYYQYIVDSSFVVNGVNKSTIGTYNVSSITLNGWDFNSNSANKIFVQVKEE